MARMAAIPTELTEGGVLAELLTGEPRRFAADPTVAGWGDLIQKIQTEGSGGEVPTTKNKAGVLDATYVKTGAMTEDEFLDKWGMNSKDYENLPQAFIQSTDTQFASGDVDKEDYDGLQETYQKEYDEFMDPKDPLGVPIKLASADTGVVPGGPYKGGDPQIAVGPYKPFDDQPGQAWENFLQQSGGKTPFNYEINLGEKGLENIGVDATVTGSKGGQWSAQGSYDFPVEQEVMGPYGGETINIPGSISGGLQYTDPNKKWTGSINYNKRNMGMPPGAFGAEFGAQF